jgi:hypothetical protein
VIPIIRATELSMQVSGVVIDNLRIAEVEVQMPSFSIPIKPFSIPNGTKILLKATVLAKDIQGYLEQKRPSGLSNFEVKAENGLLTVIAISKMLIPVQIGSQGKLEFNNGKLNFSPIRTEVAGVPAPESLVASQLKKINPIIDLTGWPLDSEIKTLSLSEGKIRVEATLTLTAEVPRRSP